MRITIQMSGSDPSEKYYDEDTETAIARARTVLRLPDSYRLYSVDRSTIYNTVVTFENLDWVDNE